MSFKSLPQLFLEYFSYGYSFLFDCNKNKYLCSIFAISYLFDKIGIVVSMSHVNFFLTKERSLLLTLFVTNFYRIKVWSSNATLESIRRNMGSHQRCSNLPQADILVRRCWRKVKYRFLSKVRWISAEVINFSAQRNWIVGNIGLLRMILLHVQASTVCTWNYLKSINHSWVTTMTQS